MHLLYGHGGAATFAAGLIDGNIPNCDAVSNSDNADRNVARQEIGQEVGEMEFSTIFQPPAEAAFRQWNQLIAQSARTMKTNFYRVRRPDDSFSPLL